MKDEEKSKEQLLRELRELRLRLGQLESDAAGSLNGNLSDDAEGRNEDAPQEGDSARKDVRLLRNVPTATIDLSGLFTRDLTDSGSFDIRGDIWATTFGKLLQALPIAAILIDSAGNVFQLNQACERAFSGYEGFRGTPFCSLFAEEATAERARALLENVFLDRQPRMREAWLKADGSTIWVRMTFRSIRIMSQRFILTLLEDLTVQKKQLLLQKEHEGELRKEILRREKKEGELRDSEERFRAVFINSHTVMLIIDHDTGRITDANPAACTFYGYTRDELLEKKIADINILSCEEIFQEMERAKSLERNYFHFRHVLASGEIRDVEVYSGPIRDRGKVQLYSIVHDITERKRARAELKSSRDTIKALFNATDDSVFLLDTQGKFLALNDVTARELRSESHKIVGCSAFDLLPPEVSAGRRERFEEVIRTAKQVKFEDERDGRLFNHRLYPVLARDGSVTSVAVFSRDITRWRATQAELTESRQRLELALEAANLGLWDWNIGTDTALFSGCTAEMLEYLPQDVECHIRSWEHAIHPEDKPRVIQVINALLEGRVPYCEIEYRLKAKSGQVRWILTLGKVVEHGDDGKPLRAVGTHLDVTERKRLEEERDRLFTLSLDMLFVAGFDGYFKQLNPAWSRTLGWTEEELQGKPLLELVHPEDRERTNAAAAELMAGRPLFSFENRYRCKDGTYRWISWNSFPLTEEKLIFGVARDTTSRKESERRLEESEELFRTTFEQAASGVCHVSPDGRFLRVNQRLCEIWGYSHDELLQLTFQEITHPEDLVGDLEEVRRMLAGDTDRYVREKRYIRKNGTHLWCNLTLSLVNDASGKPKYFIAVIEDITERKHLEGELKRLARRDSLTGAFNRQHFLKMAELEFERARRYKHPLAVLMLDVDHFKQINDTFGHHTGDVALKVVVDTCTQTLRRSDLFGRLGGEEFGAVLAETAWENASEVAERLRSEVAKVSIPTEKGTVRCSVSIGMTSCLDEDRSLDDAMRRADMALYEAKEAGRNRVVQHRSIRPSGQPTQ